MSGRSQKANVVSFPRAAANTRDRPDKPDRDAKLIHACIELASCIAAANASFHVDHDGNSVHAAAASGEFRTRMDVAMKDIVRLPARTALGFYAKVAAVEAMLEDDGTGGEFGQYDLRVVESFAADVKRLARKMYDDELSAARADASAAVG